MEQPSARRSLSRCAAPNIYKSGVLPPLLTIRPRERPDRGLGSQSSRSHCLEAAQL